MKLAGFAALSLFTVIGCQLKTQSQSETLATEHSEAADRDTDFWNAQQESIPCDPSDDLCGESFKNPGITNGLSPAAAIGSPSKIPVFSDAESADIENDVTKLLDKNFVDAVNDFTCSIRTPTPFFSGIQGKDKVAVFVSGDGLTANFYTSNVLPGLNDSNSLIRHWHIMHYYNQPKLSQPNPFLKALASGHFAEFLYRENRVTNRYSKRNGKGRITEWGDQSEARLLGIWTVAEGDRFKSHDPIFAGTMAKQDKIDFVDFFKDTINHPEWKRFMVESAWHVGIAMKCGRPILVHSGGGSVGGFLIRLLAETPGLKLSEWNANSSFALIGLEAVLTQGAKEMFDSMPILGGRLIMENHIVGASDTDDNDMTGSNVWNDTIAPELISAGFTPLKTHPVKGAKTSFWNPAEGGHGGVGFYPLRYGRLPHYTFPAL